MSNEIEVTVKGWVGQRPRLADSKGQAPMMSLRVGTTPRRRDKAGSWVDGDTTWFSVIAFGDLAENATRSLRKGDPVLVRGRLVLRRFEREGREFFNHEIVADAIGAELTFGTALYAPTARRGRDEAEVAVESRLGEDGLAADDADLEAACFSESEELLPTA